MADTSSTTDAPRLQGVVSPALPLALLEAMQAHDRPGEVLEDEDVAISLPRRFGLKNVVHTQIQRYEEASRYRRPVPAEEWGNLVRLVLRRPDAAEILEDAGARVARWFFRGTTARTAPLVRMMPVRVQLIAIRRSARRLLQRLYPGGTVETARPLLLRVQPSPASLFDGSVVACTLYTAALRELYRLFRRRNHGIRHDHCRGRGDLVCEWVGAS